MTEPRKPLRRTALVLACTLVASLILCVPAQGAARARIDKRLDGVISAAHKLGIPGGVVGVTGGGAGRFERAFGRARFGHPMTLDDHFMIGSVTKTFTATVILELVDRHRLALDQPIAKWEPRIPNARRITIRMLLNMTSGIWDEGGAGSLLSRWIEQHCSLTQPSPGCSRYWKPQQLVELATKQGQAYPPGVYNYSDTNYTILAIIAQRVTHRSFAWLVRHLILDPLHLRHTTVPTHRLTLPQPATVGYFPDLTASGAITQYLPGPLLSPSVLFGAGNLVSTLGDLRIWARALGTGALLKPSTQRLRLTFAQTPSLFQALADTGLETGLMVGYGLGLASAGGLLGHNGIVAPPGYTSELWYLPKRRATVIVLFNSFTPCQGGAELADATSSSLAQLAFGGSLQRVGVPASVCQSVTGAGTG